ncbi:tetratricopeptide repeat protein 27 homolog isoform X2 [Hibiscus syriacus]|uniref:tetratricopeptide repeat protein 27 homolog isoform X2 n=1 Tax=Hibiscus syriacus TaxID=106335 RepID=UPI001923E58D|nr:tetratricopeptide repeat protein 27 homolog isoform X2 [Hibiscus syriacus]
MNMAEREIEILRGHELRLLRCTLRPPPSDSSSSHFQHSDDFAASLPPLHALISNFLTSVEAGDYFGALSSDAARLVLASPDYDLSTHSPDRVYSELLDRVESFINEPSIDDAEKACRVFLVACVAVAALFWFTQCNLTGPVDGLPKRPLPMKAWWEGSEMVEWENWARIQLMAAGSDLLGKFSYLQYLVFAKMLLLRTRDLLFEASVMSTFEIKSISWWLFRALLIHQRILDERSSSLFDLLQVFKGENSDNFGSLEKVTSYWGDQLQNGEASTIVSIVHLEAGVLEYIFGRLDPCRLDFESAELAAGLQLSVTGILGLRTVHQVEPKAQMILVANTDSESGSGAINTSITPESQLTSPNVSEASDIFMTPKLVENGIDFGKNECGGVASTLTAVQQAVILARCLLIEKGSPHGEMQGWDMAPYIEAIDSQKSSFFILKCFCNILRIRWESTRSRTKVRALQMMDNLVESIHKPSPGIPLRLPFCYVVYIPPIPALRKQYGEILVSCGLIGEALKVFEDLELWDNVIYCYSKLEKKAAAIELIKKQLSSAPNDPKLWCSLGDITHSDTCYEKALEVSNDRSARAKRSLAYNAYGRGEYEKSKILWESALGLNSLYSNGWFALGATALKARDIEKALDGFTRAVQLDPENGEAWNNIACLHMVKKKNKESFIAFKEALKYKRDSWQMWENYSNVAFDVGNTGQALEAIKMVLNMTNNKRINVELLEKIMQYLETGENLRGNEHLVEFLGEILQQIVRSESRPELWGLYARWHRIKGDLTMCCEALLKQVRSYQGSDLWKDRDRFKSFAQASSDLCKVYMDISSSTNSRRELLTAEMHLKNTLKQAGAFSDTEEFRNLETCLDEVRIKLQAEVTAT